MCLICLMKIYSLFIKMLLFYFLPTPQPSASVAGYANPAPSSSVADRVEALKQEGEREKALIFLGSRFPIDKLQQQVYVCVFVRVCFYVMVCVSILNCFSLCI